MEFGDQAHHDVQMDGLGPMDWEPEASRPAVHSQVYKFFEDFAEWVVLGFRSILKAVGLPVVSGLGIVIKLVLGTFLLAGMLALGLYVGHSWGVATTENGATAPVTAPQPHPTVPPSQNSPAVDLLTDFFNNINSHNYSLAYEDLTPAWKRELPFKQFQASYQDKESVDCVVRREHAIAADKVEIEVELTVVQGGHARTVAGKYVAEEANQEWRLGYFMLSK